jgi:hypothetical protein
MKLKTIVLADKKAIKENGKDKVVTENRKEYLAVFSNKALKYGFENGFLESTSLVDLMVKVEEDIELAWKIIYISFITTNKDMNISYDEFVDRLDVPVGEIVWKAQSIMQPTLPEKYSEYLEELDKATDSSEKKLLNLI